MAKHKFSKYKKKKSPIRSLTDDSINNKIVFLIFLSIFLFLYWKLFFNPPASGDIISQFYPGAIFNKQYFLKHFDLPFWNPFRNCGMPNLDTGFGYNIFYLLFVYIFPLEYAAGIGYALITLLGGILAYIFFKSLKLNNWIALLSSIIFMISGDMVSYLYPGHLGKPLVLALLPLVWFFINKGFEKKKRYYFVFAGFFMGFQYFGHPQIFYYSLILTTLYFIIKTYIEFKENKKILIQSIVNYGIMGLFAVLISFNQLFSQYFYAKLTSRGKVINPIERWNFATSWSMHPIELLTYFVPSLLGLYDSTYLGWRPFVQTTDYIGFLTITIAVIGAVIFWRKKEIKFVAIFIFFTFLFGMGKHFECFYRLFYNYFPLIKKFRVPSSIYIITTFCITFLFIYGFNALLKFRENKEVKKKINIILAIFFIIIIALTIFINSETYNDILKNNLGQRINLRDLYQKYPLQADNYVNNIISKTSDMAKTDLLRLWIFFIIFLFIYYLYTNNSINKKIFIILTGLLIIIDLFIVDKKFIKTVDNYDIVAKETDVVRVLKKLSLQGEKFRIAPIPASIDNESNKWMVFKIESAFGYTAVGLNIYDDVWKNSWFNNLKLLGLMNVKYLISKRSINNPDVELVYKGSKFIYENKKFLPRYFLVDKYKVIKEPKEILNYMKSPYFNPENEVILEEDIDADNFSTKDNNIKLINWSYDEFNLKADIKNSCLLFLSEVYYPKWKAYIQNKEIKIYKANYLFRAVILPVGNYTITFKFYNNHFYLFSTIFHYFLTIGVFTWIFVLLYKKKI